MTSSQLGLPPWKIWTYLLKRFIRYWDLKNGAIWLAESLFHENQIFPRHAVFAGLWRTLSWTDLRLKNTRCLTTILEKVLFRFDMGMPGHVWAIMWHHRINLWLLLNKVYHHAKYGCIYLRSSWDIEIWKMGQSDWLRAFFKISREPDFSQTCGFRWIMQDTELNKFREFQKYSMTRFREKYEKPHFLALFPLFPKNQIFPEKSGSVTFFLLWSFNFMPNFRKILCLVFEKNSEQTHVRTLRTYVRTHIDEFKGPTSRVGGSKNE